jgi:tetratricopeptide (TPR) repeat protein
VTQGTLKQTPLAEFWALASQPGGVDTAARVFHETRQRDPQAFLFPESVLNQLGYSRLTARAFDDAVGLFKLNAEAYPASANAQDSLSDGYLARGQKDLALAAAQKCLELLPADKSDEQFKVRLRQAVEEKISRLKAAQE